MRVASSNWAYKNAQFATRQGQKSDTKWHKMWQPKGKRLHRRVSKWTLDIKKLCGLFWKKLKEYLVKVWSTDMPYLACWKSSLRWQCGGNNNKLNADLAQIWGFCLQASEICWLFTAFGFSWLTQRNPGASAHFVPCQRLS